MPLQSYAISRNNKIRVILYDSPQLVFDSENTVYELFQGVPPGVASNLINNALAMIFPSLSFFSELGADGDKFPGVSESMSNSLNADLTVPVVTSVSTGLESRFLEQQPVAESFVSNPNPAFI